MRRFQHACGGYCERRASELNAEARRERLLAGACTLLERELSQALHSAERVFHLRTGVLPVRERRRGSKGQGRGQEGGLVKLLLHHVG